MALKLLAAVILLSFASFLTRSNNVVEMLIATEYINFLIFPLLIALAVIFNNPTYLFLLVLTTIFAAIETGLIGFLINNHNN